MSPKGVLFRSIFLLLGLIVPLTVVRPLWADCGGYTPPPPPPLSSLVCNAFVLVTLDGNNYDHSQGGFDYQFTNSNGYKPFNRGVWGTCQGASWSDGAMGVQGKHVLLEINAKPPVAYLGQPYDPSTDRAKIRILLGPNLQFEDGSREITADIPRSPHFKKYLNVVPADCQAATEAQKAFREHPAPAAQQVVSPKSARKPTATITVLTHNPVIYQDNLRIKETKRAAVTGLCMYLGAKINDPDHVYTTYRWVQTVSYRELNKSGSFYDTYTENMPISSKVSEKLWYRPPTESYDSIWLQAANALGYDALYRDEPSRRFTDDLRDWEAVTKLFGVKIDGTFDQTAALATVSWGFTKGPSGPLVPSPVKINGTVWQGTPTLTGIQAQYLCDHPLITSFEKEKFKGTDDPDNTNWPLVPFFPPPGYKPSPLYRLVP